MQASAHMMDSGGGGGQWQLAAQNKRKEKARIAARARRSQEANIIMEMASELHLTQEKMRRIDKATIVKLAIDYLKAFDLLCRASTSTSSAPILMPNGAQKQQEQRQEQQQLSKRTTTKRQQSLPNDISNIENENESCNENKRNDNELECEGQQSLLSLELPTKIIKIDNTEQQDNHQQDHLNHHHHHHHERQQQQEQQKISPFSAPILTTSLIFAPKTIENSNEHYLMIEEKANGNSSFVLKPDTEISDEDDLTHLAPQAGDVSISLDIEQLPPVEKVFLDKQGYEACVSQMAYASNNYTIMKPMYQQHQQQQIPLATSMNLNLVNNNHVGVHTGSRFSTELIFCGNKNQV